MNSARFNEFCATLSGAYMVVQWGGAHVWKVGSKVFAISGWGDDEPAYTFKTTELVFEMLKDQPGLRGAPYFASRGMKWIQITKENALSDTELESYLEEAHALIVAKLSKKKQRELGLLSE